MIIYKSTYLHENRLWIWVCTQYEWILDDLQVLGIFQLKLKHQYPIPMLLLSTIADIILLTLWSLLCVCFSFTLFKKNNVVHIAPFVEVLIQ